MKVFSILTIFAAFNLISGNLAAQSNAIASLADKPTKHKSGSKNLYFDVHHIGAGKVTAEAVAQAHAKDLATEKKYGVHFIKYWVDEKEGNVYCLASAPDTQSIRKTHGEAHGLLPQEIYKVTAGQESFATEGKVYFLDVHELGAGKVTAKDVAAAHQKDLAVGPKYGVNFINYWVDTKQGIVVCLSQAPDSNSIRNAHREAHGLLPSYIEEVKQGQ